MGRYAINDRIVSEQDVSLLADAFSRGLRPLCQCKAPGIPMYIARTPSHHYIIKRMPNTAFVHHPDCDSYEIPAELSGRGALEGVAIKHNEQTGLMQVNLDFPLHKRGSLSRNTGPSSQERNPVIKYQANKLTLLSLLHYLYEEAGLNKWTPRMLGKRNWHVIAYHLTQAAERTSLKDRRLSDYVFIPRVFSLENKECIEQQQRAFIQRLRKDKHVNPVGIMIGELKSLTSSRFGYKLLIKHIPSHPIYLENKAYEGLLKHCSFEMSDFQEDENDHVLAICSVVLSDSGHLKMESLSLMATQAHWIPVENIDDHLLVDHLIDRRRAFIKGMRYNMKERETIASALLTDEYGDPVAIYHKPAQADENWELKLSQLNDMAGIEYRVAKAGELLDLSLKSINKDNNA